MATITIRNIDDAVKASLRIQAAQHDCSMEEEARRILAHALQNGSAKTPMQQPLGSRLHQHFTGLGELALAPRRPVRLPPDFSNAALKATDATNKPSRST